MKNKKIVLAIGGSDNCAGAGIQADIKTCMSTGTYCVTVITSVTAQNDYGVKRAQYVGADLMSAQLETIFEVIRPEAVKIGMIPCTECAEIIADCIRKHELTNVVFDPVMKATSGDTLNSGKDFIKTIRNHLFPICDIITPNLPEFHLLLKEEGLQSTVNHENIPMTVKKYMEKYGIKNLLLKGGHGEGEECRDILFATTGNNAPIERIYASRRIETRNTHGTGCTLSSAIASYLAMGQDMAKAVESAKCYITECIEKAAGSTIFPKNGPLFH